MAHKVRKAMADRDSEYKLAGLVEIDEAPSLDSQTHSKR